MDTSIKIVPEPYNTRGYLDVSSPDAGLAFYHKDGRTVLYSVDTDTNGIRWIHVSVSRTIRIPDYEDMRLTKDHFIGPFRYAIQILPPIHQHVNLHRNCLHLWSPLDPEVLQWFEEKA